MPDPMTIDYMKRKSCYITEIIDTMLYDMEEQGMKETSQYEELGEIWDKAFKLNQKYVKLEKKK